MNNKKNSNGRSASRPVNDTSHSRVIDLLTEATAAAGKIGITRQDFLPALVDFTAAIALAAGGEEVLHAFIERMKLRVLDHRSGLFPVRRARENDEPQEDAATEHN